MTSPTRKHTKSDPSPPLLSIAHHIIPWLTPQEVSSLSCTCTTLYHLSRSISAVRSSDASRSLEPLPIPFINTLDSPPYAFFLYTPTHLTTSPFFTRQFWGPYPNPNSSPNPSPNSSPNPNSSPSPNSNLNPNLSPNSNPNPNPNSSPNPNLNPNPSPNSNPNPTPNPNTNPNPNPNSNHNLHANPNHDTNPQFDSGVVSGVCGCDCIDNCGVSGECPCFGLRLGDVVFECGPGCGCQLGCGNRVTQRGVSVRVKIVRDVNKGWGLFVDQFISAGTFICEYAGELLTTKEARKRQKVYDDLSKRGQFTSALLVVREHLPSRKACFRINIDATRIGNVGRFINHSCDGGNLLTKLIRNAGILLPRVCFFASRDIQAGEELCFSYGDVRLRPEGLRCFCGSFDCCGVLPAEDT